MKRQIAGLLMCIRGWLGRSLLFLLAALCVGSPLYAKTAAVVQFDSGDFVYSNRSDIPTNGWHRERVPFHDYFAAETSLNQDRKVLWARFEFSAAPRDLAPRALKMDYTTEKFIVFLNDKEIYRNYSAPDFQTFASFAPAYVPLPRRQLRSGNNQIAVRFETQVYWCLGVGNVSVGPETVLRKAYERRYFAQFLGPQIVNGILGAMTLAAFFFWLMRRNEHTFGWLALVGAIWWLRNLHYSATDPLIGPHFMWEITINSLFVLCISFFAFAVSVLNVPRPRAWILGASVFGVFIVALRYTLISQGWPDLPSFLLFVPYTAVLLAIFIRAFLAERSLDRIVMLIAMIVVVGSAFHDFAFLAQIFEGATFQIQPYSSVLVFSAFWFVLGRRFFTLLDTVEDMNVSLENRIDVAAKKLLESEALRRELEVTLAVEKERERLMLEIHDGIGSNLVTALAVAEKQNHPPASINTLRRSLTDLRMAVDSLEPVEGEIPLLLASLRYRMEPDLSKAGLALDWQVEDCPPLPWLDATGALHILRILQEAVSNIITHAQATLITVQCHTESFDNREGVAIMIADNGVGLPRNTNGIGKGLENMASRSLSMQGEFSCMINENGGTVVRLWLPNALERFPVI